MCSWKILYMSVPILIGFYITEYRKDILNLIRLQSNLSSHFDNRIDLMVYVPSARENFRKRQAIRDTWASVLNSTSSLPVTLRFVVGERACDVAMEYRLDEYSCEEWQLPELADVNKKTRHAVVLVERKKKDTESENSQSDDVKKNNDDGSNDNSDNIGGVVKDGDDEDDDGAVYPVQRIEFTVQHEVLITRLGVHGVCLRGASVVTLFEATSHKEIASVTFEASPSSSSPSSSFSFKSIEPPYILPKGFRGVVVVESEMDGGSTSCDFKYWNFPWHSLYNSSNIIQFSQPPIIPPGTYLNEDVWNRRPFVVANFAYKIHEPKQLKDKILKREQVHGDLAKNISVEQSALLQEASVHGDVVFVDVVDVYRNIPQKFLLFAKEIAESDVKMILKVDDDAYVDLEAILKVIASVDYRENVWFGRFRHNWPINRHGKWAEHQYTSPVYPRFACGSGYVLTQGLIRWLGANADSLKIYQGEDVSMGIWLSAVEHRIIDDPLWQCESECISDMYSMPDLRPDLVNTHWRAKVTCGDPCGCD